MLTSARTDHVSLVQEGEGHGRNEAANGGVLKEAAGGQGDGALNSVHDDSDKGSLASVSLSSAQPSPVKDAQMQVVKYGMPARWISVLNRTKMAGKQPTSPPNASLQ